MYCRASLHRDKAVGNNFRLNSIKPLYLCALETLELKKK
jgi:hypothetical protein